jgi:benzil reductase ((S)-benzoin forming)
MSDRSRPALAIVTGTSSGIGEHAARDLLARGWTVIGIARRKAHIDHEAYTHVALDLGDLEGLSETTGARIAPTVRDAQWKRVALVNNAAITGPLGPLEHLTPPELTSVYAVNAIAPIWLMGFVGRNAASDVAVRIVNVSTGAATQGVPGLSAYGSSKAALRLAGMAFAAESASPPRDQPRRDLAILSYEPGVVDTPMQVHARGTSSDAFPWVEMFHRFRSDGLLVAPHNVTATITNFLDSDPTERFSERRHGAEPERRVR